MLILSIYLLTDFGCFYILDIVNNMAMDMACRYLFETVILFLLDIYLEAGFLDHMVVIFFTFLRNEEVTFKQPSLVKLSLNSTR